MIDFHSPKLRYSYATRVADKSWLETVEGITRIQGDICADIGCGGGIYSRALIDLGADKVTGIDWSQDIIEGARETNGHPRIEYVCGDAVAIPSSDSTFDLVLSRALIHHLEDVQTFFQEVFRVLKPGGFVIVQDRTAADVRKIPSPEHFRGYFFELYPRLFDFELARRPEAESIVQKLESAGFSKVEIFTLWEKRRTYRDQSELTDDIKRRTGRSILHKLSDTELDQLIDFLIMKTQGKYPLIEKDPWTLWAAQKGPTNRER